MGRKAGHIRAGLRRRVGADDACRSTRRAFLFAAAAWPALARAGAALAQSKQAPVLIGWLNSAKRADDAHLLTEFKAGLAALGWKEGTNYVLEERWADAQPSRLPTLARELAARKPALIVAAPTTAVIAATNAAPKTPVVQANGSVDTKLMATLARPGGMITGLTNLPTEVSEKYVELLLAAVPAVRRIGFLLDSGARARAIYTESARRTATRYRVEGRLAEAGRPVEIEAAVERLAKEGAQALVVMPSVFFGSERQRIVDLASARRWPMIAGVREFADAGALLTYGADRSALYRRAAFYVDRILKGTKPGDLPIEQPTKFELVVNMKTAKALGLTIPQPFLMRADRVIE
jgi:putative ABC transport system substrate-binding protein